MGLHLLINETARRKKTADQARENWTEKDRHYNDLNTYLKSNPVLRIGMNHAIEHGTQIGKQLITIQEMVHDQTSTHLNLPIHNYHLNDYMNETDRDTLNTLMTNLDINTNNHPGALKAPVINTKNASYHLASTKNDLQLHLTAATALGIFAGAGVTLEGTEAMPFYITAAATALFDAGLWVKRDPIRTLGESINARTDLVRTYKQTNELA